MSSVSTLLFRLLDEAGESQLAGDLAEETEAGRSSSWGVVQAVVGLLRASARAIHRYPARAFIAVGSAWSLLLILNGNLPFSPHPEVWAWVRRSQWWVVLEAMQYLLVGWSVARLNSSSRVQMVILSTAVLWSLNAMQVALKTYFLLRFGMQIVGGNVPMQLVSLSMSLALPLMVLAGGLWGVGRTRRVVNGDS